MQKKEKEKEKQKAKETNKHTAQTSSTYIDQHKNIAKSQRTEKIK